MNSIIRHSVSLRYDIPWHLPFTTLVQRALRNRASIKLKLMIHFDGAAFSYRAVK